MSRTPLVESSIFSPRHLSTEQIVLTSSRAGISSRWLGVLPRIEAAMIGRTAFLAPLVFTVPIKRLPPLIISFSTKFPPKNTFSSILKTIYFRKVYILFILSPCPYFWQCYILRQKRQITVTKLSVICLLLIKHLHVICGIDTHFHLLSNFFLLLPSFFLKLFQSLRFHGQTLSFDLFDFLQGYLVLFSFFFFQ